MPALVSALNRVDLPTLGRPTMPHFKLMEKPQKNSREVYTMGLTLATKPAHASHSHFEHGGGYASDMTAWPAVSVCLSVSWSVRVGVVLLSADSGWCCFVLLC